MYKAYILTISLIALMLTGCAGTAVDYGISTGTSATIEQDMTGKYTGTGIVKSSSGKILRTFDATLEGYIENGIIFINEQHVYDTGRTIDYTYRLTQTEFPFTYDCVRIQTLDACKATRYGSSITLNTVNATADAYEVSVTNAEHIYHIRPNGKMIKTAFFNKFLGFHTAEEIVNYTRSLQ